MSDKEGSPEPSTSTGKGGIVCPICLNEFSGQEIGTPESCDHCFCLVCIQEWSKNVNTCPIDRQVFKLILIKNQLDGPVILRVPAPDRKDEEDDEEFEEEDEATYCEVCGHRDREERLLLCDGCDAGYHLECLDPPLDTVPVAEWFCPECRPNADQETDTGVTTRQRNARVIPRTEQTERIRLQIARRLEEESSSDEEGPEPEDEAEEEPEEPEEETSSTSVSIRVRQRKSPTKKRKVTKKKRTVWRKKGGRRRRRRRRKGTKRKTSRTVGQVQKSISVKERLASNLGISPPDAGRFLPNIKGSKLSAANSAGASGASAGLGFTPLYVFGDKNELLELDDEEEVEEEEDDGATLSRNAREFNMPLKAMPRRQKYVSKSKTALLEQTKEERGDQAGSSDLLGAIIDDQTMLLHASGKHIKICSDGSLEATETFWEHQAKKEEKKRQRELEKEKELKEQYEKLLEEAAIKGADIKRENDHDLPEQFTEGVEQSSPEIPDSSDLGKIDSVDSTEERKLIVETDGSEEDRFSPPNNEETAHQEVSSTSEDARELKIEQVEEDKNEEQTDSMDLCEEDDDEPINQASNLVEMTPEVESTASKNSPGFTSQVEPEPEFFPELPSQSESKPPEFFPPFPPPEQFHRPRPFLMRFRGARPPMEFPEPGQTDSANFSPRSRMGQPFPPRHKTLLPSPPRIAGGRFLPPLPPAGSPEAQQTVPRVSPIKNPEPGLDGFQMQIQMGLGGFQQVPNLQTAKQVVTTSEADMLAMLQQQEHLSAMAETAARNQQEALMAQHAALGILPSHPGAESIAQTDFFANIAAATRNQLLQQQGNARLQGIQLPGQPPVSAGMVFPNASLPGLQPVQRMGSPAPSQQQIQQNLQNFQHNLEVQQQQQQLAAAGIHGLIPGLNPLVLPHVSAAGFGFGLGPQGLQVIPHPQQLTGPRDIPLPPGPPQGQPAAPQQNLPTVSAGHQFIQAQFPSTLTLQQEIELVRAQFGAPPIELEGRRESDAQIQQMIISQNQHQNQLQNAQLMAQQQNIVQQTILKPEPPPQNLDLSHGSSLGDEKAVLNTSEESLVRKEDIDQNSSNMEGGVPPELVTLMNQFKQMKEQEKEQKLKRERDEGSTNKHDSSTDNGSKPKKQKLRFAGVTEEKRPKTPEPTQEMSPLSPESDFCDSLIESPQLFMAEESILTEQKPRKVSSKSLEKRKRKEKKLKKLLMEATSTTADEDIPSSAKDLHRREKTLAKFNYQARVEDEVKQVLRPYYGSKKITKDEYKEIMRKTVPKITKKKGRINPVKIKSFVDVYVENALHLRGKKLHQ